MYMFYCINITIVCTYIFYCYIINSSNHLIPNTLSDSTNAQNPKCSKSDTWKES